MQARFKRADGLYRTTNAARQLYQAYRGHVAYFRFSYYELFEDQLRPFEISPSDGQLNCIFPSQRTITSGEYPLARQLLLTTTTRSLARPEVRDYLTHYLANAQQQALDARLVPLPQETLNLENAWLDGRAGTAALRAGRRGDLTCRPGAERESGAMTTRATRLLAFVLTLLLALAAAGVAPTYAGGAPAKKAVQQSRNGWS